MTDTNNSNINPENIDNVFNDDFPEEIAEETTTRTALPRIFKIGSNRVVEDESMREMSNEQVQETLAFQYPEIANATIHTTEKDGNLFVEFLPKAGRKG